MLESLTTTFPVRVLAVLDFHQVQKGSVPKPTLLKGLPKMTDGMFVVSGAWRIARHLTVRAIRVVRETNCGNALFSC